MWNWKRVRKNNLELFRRIYEQSNWPTFFSAYLTVYKISKYMAKSVVQISLHTLYSTYHLIHGSPFHPTYIQNTLFKKIYIYPMTFKNKLVFSSSTVFVNIQNLIVEMRTQLYLSSKCTIPLGMPSELVFYILLNKMIPTFWSSGIVSN